MGNIKIATLAVLASAAFVHAHGHVSNIVVNGVSYRNFDPTTDPYTSNPPIVIGWTADQLDNGFVSPDAYLTSDIICHRKATNAKGHARVAAGDTISLQWTVWPESHKGPVIDWLAPCNGNCETVDKTALRFFKIDGAGIITQGSPGYYAADALIANNNTWQVRIPSNIAPGNYVLRHEIIALHGAGSANGAQSYPQCFNLEITGSGTYQPAGVVGTALYPSNDPGVLVNIYTSSLNYQVPGGTIISGGVSSVPQSSSRITASASATTPGGGGGVSTTVAGSTSRVTTPTSTVRSTSSARTTTLVTSTTSRTTAPPATGAAPLYGQCGGSGWTGPTACVAGASCYTQNAWYAQCTPA
jgi:lytic cellulose monooxygenase (C1-hydroxylating)